MIYGMYAIRDCKAGFLAPTLDMNDDSAKRNFEHACMVSDSMFITHASDFSLYKIAEYQTDTGTIIPLEPPIHLVDADGLKKGDLNGK